MATVALVPLIANFLLRNVSSKTPPSVSSPLSEPLRCMSMLFCPCCSPTPALAAAQAAPAPALPQQSKYPPATQQSPCLTPGFHRTQNRACMRACVRVCVCVHACVRACVHARVCPSHQFLFFTWRLPCLPLPCRLPDAGCSPTPRFLGMGKPLPCIPTLCFFLETFALIAVN